MASEEIPPGYGYCTTGRAWLTCLRCGAIVCVADLHDEWHTMLRAN